MDFWATAWGAKVVRRGGLKVRPRASMAQLSASSSSKIIGVMRTILPSFTSTKTGPPVVELVSLVTFPIDDAPPSSFVLDPFARRLARSMPIYSCWVAR